MKQAVLLLMHQGNWFAQEVQAFVAARGLALVAVSSRPTDPEVFRKTKRCWTTMRSRTVSI